MNWVHLGSIGSLRCFLVEFYDSPSSNLRSCERERALSARFLIDCPARILSWDLPPLAHENVPPSSSSSSSSFVPCAPSQSSCSSRRFEASSSSSAVSAKVCTRQHVGMLLPEGIVSDMRSPFFVSPHSVDSTYRETSLVDDIDWASIDAVFCSSPQASLGLSYITEHTSFRGSVYSTEPVLEMWKLAWQEIYCDRDALAEGFDSTQKETTATCSASGCFSVPSVVQGDKFRNSLERDINLRSCIRSLPSRAEIDRCASRITTLRFGERIKFGDNFEVFPFSTGMQIGDAGWMFTSLSHSSDTLHLPLRVAYAYGISLYADRHPAPFDPYILDGCSVFMLGSELGSTDASFEESQRIISKHAVEEGIANAPRVRASKSCDQFDSQIDSCGMPGNILDTHSPLRSLLPRIFTSCLSSRAPSLSDGMTTGPAPSGKKKNKKSKISFEATNFTKESKLATSSANPFLSFSSLFSTTNSLRAFHESNRGGKVDIHALSSFSSKHAAPLSSTRAEELISSSNRLSSSGTKTFFDAYRTFLAQCANLCAPESNSKPSQQGIPQPPLVVPISFASSAFVEAVVGLRHHFGALGLEKVPLFLFSPAAHPVLEYIPFCGEWLGESLLEKTFLPEPPFDIPTWRGSGLLYVASHPLALTKASVSTRLNSDPSSSVRSSGDGFESTRDATSKSSSSSSSFPASSSSQSNSLPVGGDKTLSISVVRSSSASLTASGASQALRRGPCVILTSPLNARKVVEHVRQISHGRVIPHVLPDPTLFPLWFMQSIPLYSGTSYDDNKSLLQSTILDPRCSLLDMQSILLRLGVRIRCVYGPEYENVASFPSPKTHVDNVIFWSCNEQPSSDITVRRYSGYGSIIQLSFHGMQGSQTGQTARMDVDVASSISLKPQLSRDAAQKSVFLESHETVKSNGDGDEALFASSFLATVSSSSGFRSFSRLHSGLSTPLSFHLESEVPCLSNPFSAIRALRNAGFIDAIEDLSRRPQHEFINGRIPDFIITVPSLHVEVIVFRHTPFLPGLVSLSLYRPSTVGLLNANGSLKTVQIFSKLLEAFGVPSASAIGGRYLENEMEEGEMPE